MTTKFLISVSSTEQRGVRIDTEYDDGREDAAQEIYPGQAGGVYVFHAKRLRISEIPLPGEVEPVEEPEQIEPVLPPVGGEANIIGQAAGDPTVAQGVINVPPADLGTPVVPPVPMLVDSPVSAEDPAPPGFETVAYSDGTTATGVAPLPEQSPAQQDAAGSTPASE